MICETCHGQGSVNQSQCEQCQGSGIVSCCDTAGENQIIKKSQTLPHIRLARNYWEIRVNGKLVGLSHKFKKLKSIWPGRTNEIEVFYGDTKKPI